MVELGRQYDKRTKEAFDGDLILPKCNHEHIGFLRKKYFVV